jgi:hypothetical protein
VLRSVSTSRTRAIARSDDGAVLACDRHGAPIALPEHPALEVFNLLNLLNPSWGLVRTPNETILQHVGQTSGTTTQSVFHFNAANAGTSTQNIESGYQLQLSLRYSF